MRLRDTRRGQAMVEMAMLLPVLLLLFLGAWTAANLIDDNNAAAQATRAGARLAAELGNGGYTATSVASGCQATSKDPCQIDKDIIDQVLPIVSPQLTNAKISEIDIYQPFGCTGITPFVSGTCPPNNGAYCTSAFVNTYTPVCTGGVTENVDVYNVTGLTYTTGSVSYTLDLRSQTHPAESELGVRLVFKYTSPALTFFTQTDTQYTVMRLAPTS